MRALYALTALFVACSAASRAEPMGPGAAAAAPGTQASATDAGTATESPANPAPVAAASTADAAAKTQARATQHCPDGMVYIEDEYCSEVEQTCVDSWYDKSNKKKVCEKFEPPSKCVGERIRKRYCIDRFSWPNVKGERPEVMNNFYQAQVKCAAVGKRMCTESEWTLACEGPEMKPFPYGYERDPAKCNGDHPWDSPNMTKVAQRDPTELARLWRGVRSGSQPECVSDYGVHDLPANNDEVVANEQTGTGWKTKYASVHTGGPWYKGVRNQCRPKIYTHDEGFYYYFLGFRCCANPDGAENEPLTEKQAREGMKWGTVERLARFTVAEMKEKLELKKTGRCSCEPKDALCKTMCGTLLGPDAKDATGDHLKPDAD